MNNRTAPQAADDFQQWTEAPGCDSHGRSRWQNVIITLAGQIAESLPPNGIDFLVFQVFCEDSLSAETPRTEPARRAVDVNRPVTTWCAPAAALPVRSRTVTAGLTSPARLYPLFAAIQRTSMPSDCSPAADVCSALSVGSG
jgi:hypothetical protein